MSATSPGPLLIIGLACILLAILVALGVIVLIAIRRGRKINSAKQALRREVSEVRVTMGRVRIERR